MDDLLVLCYHAVSERWPAPLSVAPELLTDQVGLLLRRGYRGVTFTGAVTERPTGKRLVVTFDDGYRSVVTRAKPLLDELGVPGTIFVATDYIGSDTPMSWSGIEQWLGT